MAGGAALLAQVDEERDAETARERARNMLSAPAPSPEEAAGAVRDSQTLGISPEAIYDSPMRREEARGSRDFQAIQDSPRLQAFVNDPENAAASRDDFNVLREVENIFTGGPNHHAGPAPVINTGDPYPNQPIPQETQGDAGGGPGIAFMLDHTLRQLQDNLTSPEWWRQQGEAAKRNTNRWFGGAANDIGTQWRVGNLIQEQANLGWRAIEPGGNGLTEAELSRLDELNNMNLPNPETWVGTAMQSVPLMLSGFSQGARRATPGAAAGFTAGAGAALVLGQAGPQVATPEEVVTVPTLAISGAMLGARTGFTIGMTEQSGRQEAGLAYAEYRQMRDEFGNPMDENAAKMAALIVGGVNGLLEVAELRTIIRAFPGGETILHGMTRSRMRQLLLRPTFRQALLAAAGRVLHTGAVEGATEGLQEISTIAGRHLAAQWDGRAFEQPTFEQSYQRVRSAAIYGAEAGVVFGAAGATTGLVLDTMRARRAEQDVAVLDALSSASQRSNLRRRLPERFHAWVDSVTQNGPLDTVWVDAQAFRTFFQENNVDPAQVADALEGVGRQEYEQALAGRDDIAIPIATFATRIAGTPAYEGLREHVRLHPDAATLAEARADEANQERAQETIDRITSAQEFNDNTLEAEQLISRDLARRLDLAGVTVSDANRQQAEVIARGIVVLAQKSGANPFEFYKRYWADLRGPFEETPAMATKGQRDYAAAGPVDVDAFARQVMADHGLADLRLTQHKEGDLLLDVLGVDKKQQRNGRGTRAMQAITAFADKHGLRLRVTPPKRGGAFGTTSQARARAFLARHGFVENKGARKDASIAEAMYRPPTGQRRVDQSENPTGTPRFDARAVDAAGGTSTPGIPEIGSAEFVLLVEAAHEKLEAGRPLSYLEDYALKREAAAQGAGPSGMQHTYFSSTGRDGTEGDPNAQNHFDRHGQFPGDTGNGPRPHAGPLPPLADAATRENANDPRGKVSLTEGQLSPQDEARLRALMAEHAALAKEIEQRMEAERDLPSVQEARKDAGAMRAAAYCAARERLRDIARMQAVGGAIGGTLAVAGGAAVAGAPSPLSDAAPNNPQVLPIPRDQLTPGNIDLHNRPGGDAPAPVALPASDTEAAAAALPAEQAAAATLPEDMEIALSEASKTAPDADEPAADEPITTNNEAARRLGERK